MYGGDIMRINKAYKFGLYQNDKKILINKTFGCTGLVYNHCQT